MNSKLAAPLAIGVVALISSVLFAVIMNARLDSAKERVAVLESRLAEVERESKAAPTLIQQNAERLKTVEDQLATALSSDAAMASSINQVQLVDRRMEQRLAAIDSAIKDVRAFAGKSAAGDGVSESPVTYVPAKPKKEVPDHTDDTYSFKVTSIEPWRRDDLDEQAKKLREMAKSKRSELNKLREGGKLVPMDTVERYESEALQLERKAKGIEAIAAKSWFVIRGIDGDQRLVTCYAAATLSAQAKSIMTGDVLTVRGEREVMTEDELVIREAIRVQTSESTTN